MADPCPYVGCPNEADTEVMVTSLSAPPQPYPMWVCSQHAADPEWMPEDTA